MMDPRSLLLVTIFLVRQPGMWLFPMWPLETVAPLSGAVLDDFRQSCSDSEASDDDLLSVGALAPMNRPAVCCAWLDDFD